MYIYVCVCLCVCVCVCVCVRVKVLRSKLPIGGVQLIRYSDQEILLTASPENKYCGKGVPWIGSPYVIYIICTMSIQQ